MLLECKVGLTVPLTVVGLIVTTFAQRQRFAHPSKLRRYFRVQASEAEKGRGPQYAIRPHDQIGQRHAPMQEQQPNLVAEKNAVLQHLLRQQPRSSKDSSGRLRQPPSGESRQRLFRSENEKGTSTPSERLR